MNWAEQEKRKPGLERAAASFDTDAKQVALAANQMTIGHRGGRTVNRAG
jgi:hypothetical protein